MAAPMESTPQTVTFARLQPRKACFSCGSVRSNNLRLLKNATFEKDYCGLVKQSLLVQLPEDVDARVCVTCIRQMQKFVDWRKEVLERLRQLVTEAEERKGEITGTPTQASKR